MAFYLVEKLEILPGKLCHLRESGTPCRVACAAQRRGRRSGLGRALSLLEGSGGWEEESLGKFPAGMCPAFLAAGEPSTPAVHGGTMGSDLSGLEVDFRSQGRY